MTDSDSDVRSTSPDDSSEEEDVKSKRKANKKKSTKLDYKLLFIEETEEELKYRAKLFPENDDVLTAEVKCTSCNRNLLTLVKSGQNVFRHLTLDVLLCKKCLDFFADGEFSADDDGTDKYCRWCGQGGTLYCCAKCPCAFCKSCIKRNLSASVLADLEREDWLCLICNSRPMWRLRAICAAALEYTNRQKRLIAEKRKRNLVKLEEKRKSPHKRRILVKRRNSSSDPESRDGTPEPGCSESRTTNHVDVRQNGRPVRSCTNKFSKGMCESSEAEINHVSDDEHEKGSKKKERNPKNSDNLPKTGSSMNQVSSHDPDFEENMPEVCDEKMSKKALLMLQEAVADISDVMKDVNENIKILSERKVKLKNVSKPIKVSRLLNYLHKICERLRADLDSIESDMDLCYDHWKKKVVQRERKSRRLTGGNVPSAEANSIQVVEVEGPLNIKSGSSNAVVAGDEGKVTEMEEQVPKQNCDASESETIHASKADTTHVAEEELTVGCDATKNCSSTLDVEGIASKLVSSISKVQRDSLDGRTISKPTSDQSSGVDVDSVDDGVETSVGGEAMDSDCSIGREAQSGIVVDQTDKHEGDGKNMDKPMECADVGCSEAPEDRGSSPRQVLNAQAESAGVEESCGEEGAGTATALDPCEENSDKTLASSACDGTELNSVGLNDSSDMFADDDVGVVTGIDTPETAADKSANENNDKAATCDDDDGNSVCTFEALCESADGDTVDQSETPVKEEEKTCKKEINKPLIFVRKDLMAASFNGVGTKSEINDDATKIESNKDDELPVVVNGELSNPEEKSVSNADKSISLIEEARRALLKSSTDDESDYEAKTPSKRKRKLLSIKKCDSREFEARAHKSRIRINPCSKGKQKIESDVDSDALDSDETSKHQRSLKKIKAAKFESDLSKSHENCAKLEEVQVVLKRLSKVDDEKYTAKYIDKLETSKKDDDDIEKESDVESTHDREVHRLCNMKLLKRSRNRNSSGSSEDATPKKKKKKKVDKDKGVDDNNSPEGSRKSLSEVDDDTFLSDTQDEEREIARQERDCTTTENNMAKKILLDMSSSDESGECDDEADDETTKTSKNNIKIAEDNDEKASGENGDKEIEHGEEKSSSGDEAGDVENVDNACVRVEKMNSIEGNDVDQNKKDKIEDIKSDEDKKVNIKSDGDEEASAEKKKLVNKTGESDDDSTDSDTKVVKKSWRRDKLLSGKLSLTDSSEEERRWEKNKAKREEKAEMVKKNVRKVLGSDSDDFKEVSDDSSSDSDFVSKKRPRGKENKSDSGSVKISDSDSSSKKKSKPKRRRIRQPVSDSSDSDVMETSQRSGEGQGKGRKNIRRVIKDGDVAEATRRAAKEEEDRRKRIAEKQKAYNQLYEIPENFEALDKLVLDFDPESKEELVSVHPKLVQKLKPHQVKGVKFMWDACFESVQQIKKSKGTGCILAHCMGLGKTFQVVTLAHTVLSNKATKVKTILVVVPKSTVLNWISEFNYWLKDTRSKFMIGDLSKTKKYKSRMLDLQDWHLRGGIMVLSYEMFRDLALLGPQKLRKKADQEQLYEALLDPGPNLVVCDEGHLLKNEATKISKAMTKIGTLRRIVLTGTPLQNNLAEYHCMVQFVKPNLLGTRKEFQNRFVNPIINGSYVDSNAQDVKIMKRRAHVLHKMLEGSVQRFDYAVLTPYLPPKQEYAIFIRLTELQIKLYRHYLDHNAPESKARTAKLFTDFHILQRICTHPRVLQMNLEKNEKTAERKRIMESDSEGSLKDFIDDGSSAESVASKSDTSDSDVVCVGGEDGDKPAKKPVTRRTRQNAGAVSESEPEVEEEVKKYQEWWQPLVEDDSVFSNLCEGGKLLLLFSILRECEKIGDKVLVFSQSLFSLDLIEYFLRRIDEATQDDKVDESLCNHAGSWTRGLDYFRFDGGTSLDNRSSFCKAFNNEDNHRARLFLISTKAGGLGINLFGANRVIIFDASWNPSHDVQSIFRVYRFGQKKPCYIYRFLSKGTMEEKIYDRQVTKLSLSCRVVDEQQIERHYNMADLQELYNFNPEPSTTSTPILPKDRLLAELLKEHEKLIETYHEHDSLLENKEEEELNEEERKAAWEDYENEKKGKTQMMPGFMTGLPQVDPVALKEALRKENPALTDQELDTKLAETVQRIMMLVRMQQAQIMNGAVAQQNAQNAAFQQQLRNYNYQQPPQVFKTMPVLQNIATKQTYPMMNMANMGHSGGAHPKQFYSPAAGGYVYNSYAPSLPTVPGTASMGMKLKSQLMPSGSNMLPKVDNTNKPVFLNPAAASRKTYNRVVNAPRDFTPMQGTAGKGLEKKQTTVNPPSNDDIQTID